MIDPKSLKKHSDIVRQYSSSIAVVGNRERTETGYRVPGFAGKTFETLYEVLLRGSSTDVLVSSKTRVIRVVAGSGFVLLHATDVEPKQYRLIPGDEVVLPAKVAYRITTTSNDLLELFITQGAGYEKSLKVVKDGGASVVASSDDLAGVTREDALKKHTRPKRIGSKAAEQQAAKATARGIDVATPPTTTDTKKTFSNAAVSGVNPQPSLGRFSEEGAG
jgi:hypothetical protein